MVDEPIVVDGSALRYATAVEMHSRTVASVAVHASRTSAATAGTWRRPRP